MAESEDAGLPPLLLLLTVVTGLVDAVAYLRLGHVFVANMTGNVVFLGFAAAKAPGLSVWGALLAIACFIPGGLLGGRVAAALGPDRRHQLRGAVSAQTALFAIALPVAALAGDHPQGAFRYVLIALLAAAMGVQNAAARRLAVPGFSTTVLTMTLTDLALGSRLGGGDGSGQLRRVLSIAAMLLGAFVGVLLLDVTPVLTLALAATLLILIGLLTLRGRRTDARETA